MSKYIAPALVALAVLVSGLAITSNDGDKDKVKTESTSTTTQPEGTSTTTSSTPSGSSTTTTTDPDADSDGCPDSGFGSLMCTPEESDEGSGSPACEDDATFWERLNCRLADADEPTDDTSDPDQPGGDVVLNLQKCQVDLDNIDYGFYHRGKLAVENFDAPFRGDVKTMEGQKEFLQDLVQRGCVDPSAMASYARHLGIIPKDSDDATVNRLAVDYTTNAERWQRHVNLMVTKLNAAVLVRTVDNGDPNATTDGQRHIGGKRPPEVFKEPLKGSCKVIVEVWVQGEVFSFCPGCKQPVRRTPTAPPASPVTPPCTTCTPPPSTPCRRNCGTTTTTRPPGGGTTTTTRPPAVTTTTRPTTTTTRPVVLCPSGPDAGEPAPGGDIEKCRKSTPGEGTTGD